MEFNFKSYDNSRQSISYCEVDKCKKVIELREQLQRKEQECGKLKQTLAEIKELIQSEYCIEIGSCEFCDEVGDCLNRKILQKISECEVNNGQ